MKSYRVLVAAGYISVFILSLLIACTYHNEQHLLALSEEKSRSANESRRCINRLNMQITRLSLLGETVSGWEDGDAEQYHSQRMVIDSTLCAFGDMFHSEREEIDSLRDILASKERQMKGLAQVYSRQRVLNRRIADKVPAIARQSAIESPRKAKRTGFLGLFGKKEETKPSATTSMLHSLNNDVVAGQQLQNQFLSEQTDSLSERNATLNNQLHGLICRIDSSVQSDLQVQESEIAAMREKSFMQIGGLAAFILLLLLALFIIIHRDARRIRQHREKTADLIGQLQRSVRQNEELIASRKKAMHTVTHELRTPLAAITGYAGLMEKEHDAGKIGMYVQNIRQSSARMREMLNALLSFFRLDNGKEQPKLFPCRISAITRTLETEFMPAAMSKGLALTVRSLADAVVLTDRERILQIGNNLLSNAVKFTESGSVSLTADYGNGILTLVVEDTGTGMTEAEQGRVFGAFERLANAAAKDGFGLGLSIVRHIVSMLGGSIRLESERGKGSRFTVEIPMQPAGELPEQAVHGYARRDDRYYDVVAIDNDEVLLLMLKEMYAQAGIHCDTCTDTAELMEMIRRKEYALLLTDLKMPEINGFDLLELLRTSNVGNSRSIPVVVATASGSCGREELMERGFAGCLFKPFSMSELMEVSDQCAMKGAPDEMPDFSTLLSYGNEPAMLEKLIKETGKEMQAVKDAGQRKDLQGLAALTHHLRSSWEILHADRPLRELYRLLHCGGTPDDGAIRDAVDGILAKGMEIVRLAKEERRRLHNG